MPRRPWEARRAAPLYLSRTVFYEDRPFTRAQFQACMFAQSQPSPERIELVRQLKARHGLKVVAVSNEGCDLNAYRMRTFQLDGLVDALLSSCFVHLRKPDADLFRLALDIAQAPARQVVYIENTPLFVQIAAGLGIRSILHTDEQGHGRATGVVGLAAWRRRPPCNQLTHTS